MKFMFLSFILLSSFVYGQNAREIINHYLDTVSNGNVENWSKIKSTYIESESLYSQNSFDQTVSLVSPDKPSFQKIYTLWPQRRIDSYSDSTFNNLVSSIYFLKNKTIIVMGNLPAMVKPASPQGEYDTEFIPLTIWKLLNKSKSVELIGLKEFPIDGITCYEITITIQERSYSLYINKDTFLLEYWNGREDNDTSILTKYYNYKKVGDFLIPMSDCLMRKGIIYFWANKKKIEINSHIDSGIFIYSDK
jgi:hypothetical protein